jgi:hypothetical protein
VRAASLCARGFGSRVGNFRGSTAAAVAWIFEKSSFGMFGFLRKFGTR